MRVVVVSAIILATISLLLLTPAGAQSGAGSTAVQVNIGIPYVVGPCFTAAMPFAQGSATLLFANQSSLAHDFTGSFALSFPAVQGLSPDSPQAFSPAIAQTTSETIVASRSYFFADFLSA